jgi:hypothetical protein
MRFADARLAGHRQDAAAPLHQVVDCCLRRRQLAIAADQAPGTLRLVACALAEEAPRRHRLGLSLQCQFANGLEVELSAGQLARGVGHIRLTARRCGLEPLREDHRVAQDGVIHARFAPEHTRDAMARVDTDVDAELGVVR